jgi:hypothetical protein
MKRPCDQYMMIAAHVRINPRKKRKVDTKPRDVESMKSLIDADFADSTAEGIGSLRGRRSSAEAKFTA